MLGSRDIRYSRVRTISIHTIVCYFHFIIGKNHYYLRAIYSQTKVSTENDSASYFNPSAFSYNSEGCYFHELYQVCITCMLNDRLYTVNKIKNKARAPHTLYYFCIPSIYGKSVPVYRQDESRPRRDEFLQETGIQIFFFNDIVITKSTTFL